VQHTLDELRLRPEASRPWCASLGYQYWRLKVRSSSSAVHDGISFHCRSSSHWRGDCLDAPSLSAAEVRSWRQQFAPRSTREHTGGTGW
jgi:hypothetical protein